MKKNRVTKGGKGKRYSLSFRQFAVKRIRSHTFFNEFALHKEISGHKGHHLHTISVAIKKKKQKESACSIWMKFKILKQESSDSRAESEHETRVLEAWLDSDDEETAHESDAKSISLHVTSVSTSPNPGVTPSAMNIIPDVEQRALFSGTSVLSSPRISLLMLNNAEKSCLEAAELRKQLRNSIGGVEHLSHEKFEDTNKMLLNGGSTVTLAADQATFPASMCLISNYKTDKMLYSDQNAYDYPDKLKNVVKNPETKIVEDFDAAMQQPSINFNLNRPSVIITNVVVERSCHKREVIYYDGPKVHASSTMLKKFVYHRFKLLSSTEKTTFLCFRIFEQRLERQRSGYGRKDCSNQYSPIFWFFLASLQGHKMKSLGPTGCCRGVFQLIFHQRISLCM
ncbi:hypothetical protein DAPPUDRAFT_228140 [Daphnia pulex]|uniref:Uncharacterized protein n=1 Tax=Daphnia pulex TaxID=6669 RepID=E9HBD2_DAPPU|nr:hypothetical protein DAPPUDRAFT_228140 [Daphnia pulex]|eukprot:EFX70965.1 hypothetical protein DAPPUDRAFT_228140 [Daphnia pulex]